MEAHLVLVTCLATHALVGGFAVGDRTGLSLQGAALTLTLTPRMRRRIAVALRDRALHFLFDGPDDGWLAQVEHDLAQREDQLNARIDAVLDQLPTRRALAS